MFFIRTGLSWLSVGFIARAFEHPVIHQVEDAGLLGCDTSLGELFQMFEMHWEPLTKIHCFEHIKSWNTGVP